MLMSSVTHWPKQWALHQNPFPLTSNPIYWTILEIRGNHSPIRPLSQCQVSQWVGSGQKWPVFYLVLDCKLLLNILNFGIQNSWYPISLWYPLVWDEFIDTGQQKRIKRGLFICIQASLWSLLVEEPLQRVRLQILPQKGIKGEAHSYQSDWPSGAPGPGPPDNVGWLVAT